jgi:hypothetical protein
MRVEIFVIGQVRRRALNATEAREDFADVGTTIFLNPLSQAHKTKMSREVTVMELVLASLNTGLEQRDHIHVFRMLEGTKEGAALLARIIVETDLGLETKVQDVSMNKVENVQEIIPDRGQNVQSRVKPRDSQGQHIPEERIAIAILCTSSGYDCGEAV